MTASQSTYTILVLYNKYNVRYFIKFMPISVQNLPYVTFKNYARREKKVFCSTFNITFWNWKLQNLFRGKASSEKNLMLLCNMNSQFLSLAPKLGFWLELLALNIHTFEYINPKIKVIGWKYTSCSRFSTLSCKHLSSTPY